jgi:hypothetical protein
MLPHFVDAIYVYLNLRRRRSSITKGKGQAERCHDSALSWHKGWWAGDDEFVTNRAIIYSAVDSTLIHKLALHLQPIHVVA